MFNDWALKKWSLALSKDFPLDRASFLICSLIPLSYTEIMGEESLVVVDVSDIEKHTKVAKEGCELLIDKGVAKWASEYKKASFGGKTIYTPTQPDPTRLVIGTSPNLIRCKYFFEELDGAQNDDAKKANGRTVPIARAALPSTPQFNTPKPEPEQGNIDTELLEWLNTKMDAYRTYCEKIRLMEKPKKVEDKIKEVLAKVRGGKKLQHIDILSYLDCINAMVLEWTDVPNRYTDIKLRQMATKVLSRTTDDMLIKVIPYFVEHYPTWAAKGFETTSIHMLNFHIDTCIRKMKGTTAGKKSYRQDDRL